MKKLLGIVAAVSLIALAGPAFASNNLAVTGAAAIDGSYGLAVTIDGDTPSAVYVEDDSPNNETTYRATFKVDMNNYVMMNSASTTERQSMFKIRDLDGTISNPLSANVRMGGDGYLKLYIKILDDDHPSGIFVTNEATPRAFETNLPASGPVTITIEFQGSSSTGVNDGIVKLYKNGTLKRENTGLSFDTANVDRIQLGALGIRAGHHSSGTFYLDSFESYRTLTP